MKILAFLLLFVANNARASTYTGDVYGRAIFGEGSTLTFTNPVTFASSVTIGGEFGLLAASSITARAANFGSGQEGSGITINGVKYNTMVFSGDTSNAFSAHFTLHEHSTSKAPLILSGRSNANSGTHTSVTVGQSVLDIMGTGVANNSGTSYSPFGLIQMVVSATGTVSATSSPGNIILATPPDGSNTPLPRLTVDSQGNAILAAGGAFFGSGAHITDITVVSTAAVPNFNFTNTTYNSVVVATVTFTIRDIGNKADVSLVSITSNAATNSNFASLWIDGGCSIAPACMDAAAGRVSTGGDGGSLSFADVTVYGLTVGTHTIGIRYRTSGGTANIYGPTLSISRIKVTEHP